MITNVRMWLDRENLKKIRELTSHKYSTQKDMLLDFAEEMLLDNDWKPEPTKRMVIHSEFNCDEETAKQLRIKALLLDVSVSDMFRQYIEKKLNQKNVNTSTK